MYLHGVPHLPMSARPFSGSNYVCADVADGMRTCTLTCTVVSDCSQGMETLDADNYECSEGLCVYLGCTSDQECASDYPGYVCR